MKLTDLQVSQNPLKVVNQRNMFFLGNRKQDNRNVRENHKKASLDAWNSPMPPIIRIPEHFKYRICSKYVFILFQKIEILQISRHGWARDMFTSKANLLCLWSANHNQMGFVQDIEISSVYSQYSFKPIAFISNEENEIPFLLFRRTSFGWVKYNTSIEKNVSKYEHEKFRHTGCVSKRPYR